MPKKLRDKICADCGRIISRPNFGIDSFCWSLKCSPDRHGRMNPPVRLAEDDPLNQEPIERFRADIDG